eukprot:TRINITY_DN759_c0_g1_i1.p1 TRINITY_DN759_c0_g1~~TRINITY_DN759_c0_g1_i1.p1  ORF type:complete len:741 (-),score=136.27 TRINITY_DN759_c0_g1_i1:554-2776(-)
MNWEEEADVSPPAADDLLVVGRALATSSQRKSRRPKFFTSASPSPSASHPLLPPTSQFLASPSASHSPSPVSAPSPSPPQVGLASKLPFPSPLPLPLHPRPTATFPLTPVPPKPLPLSLSYRDTLPTHAAQAPQTPTFPLPTHPERSQEPPPSPSEPVVTVSDTLDRLQREELLVAELNHQAQQLQKRLVEQRQAHEVEVNALQVAKYTQEVQIESLSGTVAELHGRLEHVVQQNESLLSREQATEAQDANVSSLREEVHRLQQEKEAMKLQCSSLQAQLSLAQSSASERATQLMSQVETSDNFVNDIQSLTRDVKRLSDEVRVVTQEKHQVQTECSAALERERGILAQLDQAQSENSALSLQLHTLQGHDENYFSSLQQQLASADVHHEQMKAAMEQLQADNLALHRSLEEEQQQHEVVVAATVLERDELLEEMREQDVRIASLQRQHSTLLLEQEQAAEGERTSRTLQAQLAKVSGKLSCQESYREALQSKLESSQAQLSSLSEQHASCLTTMAALETQYTDCAIELVQARETVQSQKGALAQAREQAENLKRDLVAARALTSRESPSPSLAAVGPAFTSVLPVLATSPPTPTKPEEHTPTGLQTSTELEMERLRLYLASKEELAFSLETARDAAVEKANVLERENARLQLLSKEEGYSRFVTTTELLTREKEDLQLQLRAQEALVEKLLGASHEAEELHNARYCFPSLHSTPSPRPHRSRNRRCCSKSRFSRVKSDN